jgi:hypothetical protein
MEVLNVKEFVSIYQYAVFAQVRAIFDSLEPDSDFGEILINYTEDSIDKDTYGGIFTTLLPNSNFTEVIQVLSHFRFVEPLRLEDRFVFFGRDSVYNFDIGVDFSNGKVVLFDAIQNAYTYIAETEDGFLGYLRYYLEYTMIPIELQIEDRASLFFRDKVVAAVGGDNYADYYRFVFPINDGSNKVHIIEFPFKL